MDTMGERLVWARKKAGYVSARAAALDNGWVEVTYRSHETGGRAFDLDAATRYSRIFKVEPLWLLHGVGQPLSRRGVPIVGLAGAGPQGTVAFAESDGELGDAPAAPNASHRTVAVEVRGDSMHGTAEDGWLIYYDDRRDPPDESLLAQLCVVGLADGRVLVKWLHAGSAPGLYDLESAAAPALRDVAVEWAARVTAIIPRPSPKRVGRRG
ncbi:MAG: XRE family transcriptional regulator [Bauldia sp.]|nr:XRE family transcriptional regulator [Bauldia sp.]